jgi:2-amino-4-hydroxy-6-hydroxymethyldihydropteridine diphosphokinase
MTSAVIALGANLGDPLAAMRGAVSSLGRHPAITVSAVSDVYETDPVGGPEQPRFLNAVAVIETSLTAHELLQVTQSIEQEWHRTREVHWGPRTLDLDIIAMGDLQLDSPELVIPHPRAHTRAFVLVPWLDIQPEAALPGLGLMQEARAALDVAGIERTELRLT